MKAIGTVIGALALAGVAGCGSRVETTSAAVPSTVAAPATSTTVAQGGGSSTTTASGPTTSGPSPSAPSTTTQPTTTTTASGGFDLADFCAKTKQLNLADVTAFEAYDTASAFKLVVTFDKIEKAAPPELAQALKDMRPLIDALNQQVKSGAVHDRESLKAWLQGLNQTNPAALEQWVRGQATVAPYIKDHCS